MYFIWMAPPPSSGRFVGGQDYSPTKGCCSWHTRGVSVGYAWMTVMLKDVALIWKLIGIPEHSLRCSCELVTDTVFVPVVSPTEQA